MAQHTTRNPQPAPTPPQLVPKLLAWFAANARDLPWRRTRDPYAIWISEIMLQQTQVKTVIPYWERWLRELPTIQSLAKAKPEKIHKLWEGLGYYTRVRNLQKAAQQIVAEHDGKFPENFDAILALPGIGRYTAGAIASIAFNQPTPILDGNVIRVLTRLHGIADDPHEKKINARLWQLAGELVAHAKAATDAKLGAKNPSRPLREEGSCSFLNQSLMELGAILCTPRSPDCAACPVAKDCTARHEHRVDEIPHPKQRAAITARRFLAFIIEHDGKFLVQQRAADIVNAHLWEFPNCEARAKDSVAAVTRKHFGAQPKSVEKVFVVKHSITRYRLTTEAYHVSFEGTNNAEPKPAGVWRTLAQLHKLAFTAAHRQIVTQLGKP